MSIEIPSGNVVPLKAPEPSALPTSNYLMSGAPTTCAACASPFAGKQEHSECWHGPDGRYYCSPACAPPPRRSKRHRRADRIAA